VPVIDAVIIGGGPAGSTAARLLAQWGHSVTIVTPSRGRQPTFAECLPPSTRKLFVFLGVQEAIDRANFFRTTGNTVWWGKARRRVEPYPEGSGYQVLRSEFDSLLLDLARQAGVNVQAGKAFGSFAAGGNPDIELEFGDQRSKIDANFVLDCSGRAGVLGRFLRTKHSRSRTVALCAVWKDKSGWKLPDPSHTLVESYGDGWAWSVPLSPLLRHVAVMVDPAGTRMVRGNGLAATYHAELAKTRAFQRIFAHSALDHAPWGREASLYTSRQFCGPGFLLAGDAGSIIDPLSSFGVKKAMVSGWIGAVVANTCLRRPAMQDTALQFYENREREVYRQWRELSGSWFRRGGDQPFWEDRAGPPDPPAPTVPLQPDAVRAWEELRRKPSIRLRRSGAVLQPEAAIEGDQIVLREAMLGDVNLVRLSQIAEHHSQVPDVFEAYNRACAPVALPNFLAALATLIAGGVLTDQPGRSL
jgi:flavin-dependent dehydrogenase